MKHITFYLDFISPYAYLAFEQLPKALEGLSYSVSYRPVLFAALLQHHGQLGPAEIPSKRDWTYRQVLWLARKDGIALQMPQSHPFNPLALLRLATACGLADDSKPGDLADAGRAGKSLAVTEHHAVSVNRYVCESIFRHVWQGGAEAADSQRLEMLKHHLDLQHRMSPEAAKQGLKTNTDDAISKGVFGVPAFEMDGMIFWGLDALPMLADALRGDAWFGGAEWNAVTTLPAGALRQR